MYPKEQTVHIDDLKIRKIIKLEPPVTFLNQLPVSGEIAATVAAARTEITDIVHGRDPRLLVIVGPCSIHDTESAFVYARQLAVLRKRYQRELCLIMRVYFEKPRTTIGWKGLINDPDLNGTCDINKGLRLARALLLRINALGLPAATEFLDVITPQYYADLISWGAIGARTTESQVHRQLASGLSCPVGFKNGTDGNLKIAADAVAAAANSHYFLSVTKNGHSAIVETAGNEDCHIILRGGKEPNYHSACIKAAVQTLTAAGFNHRVMVDCSHANSRKDFKKQLEVAADLAAQIIAGEDNLMGVMIESYLTAGRQDLGGNKPLNYGQSVTDACLGWDDSEEVIALLAAANRHKINRLT